MNLIAAADIPYEYSNFLLLLFGIDSLFSSINFYLNLYPNIILFVYVWKISNPQTWKWLSEACKGDVYYV